MGYLEGQVAADDVEALMTRTAVREALIQSTTSESDLQLRAASRTNVLEVCT